MSHPKVTEEDLDKAINKVEYTLLPDGRTTICTLTLDNNFTVRGESSCVSVENYNEELGQTYALKKARENLWPFLGFRLADELHREKCKLLPIPETVEAGQQVKYFEVVEGQHKGQSRSVCQSGCACTQCYLPSCRRNSGIPGSGICSFGRYPLCRSLKESPRKGAFFIVS